MAIRRDGVGLGRVAARGFGPADGGESRGGEQRRRGECEEKEASHAPNTPPPGFLSQVEYRFVADRHLHELLRLYWSGVPTVVVPIRLFGVLRKLKGRSFTQP